MVVMAYWYCCHSKLKDTVIEQTISVVNWTRFSYFAMVHIALPNVLLRNVNKKTRAHTHICIREWKIWFFKCATRVCKCVCVRARARACVWGGGGAIPNFNSNITRYSHVHCILES